MHTLTIQLPPKIVSLVNDTAIDNFGRIASGGENEADGGQVELAGLKANELFLNTPSDLQMADCCLSGIWLLHGFLDDSHAISQSVATREGSYWHGIMHRLEKDFWNSKYWYRKVGNHPVIQELADNHSGFPEGFVDATESAFANGGDPTVAALAKEEWVRLFEYCYESALR
jgi:hypothetical protein